MWFCIFHKFTWFTSRTVSNRQCVSFLVVLMDLPCLSAVALGQSILQLRRAPASWLMGMQVCSRQPACQAGVGSLTLVSLALLPDQQSGLGVSPDSTYNLRHDVISHEPLVPRETRQNSVTTPTRICHQCWWVATSLLRLDSRDIVLSFYLFLDQAGPFYLKIP